MFSRAERRHHLARMKAKAKRVYPDNYKAIKYANHLKVCSCFLCGNARKHYGPKLKEV